MKKLFLLLTSLVLVLSSGCWNGNTDIIKNITGDTRTDTGSYLGSDYEGNYVWGGAMNLAWNELNDNVIQEKIMITGDNQKAKEMVTRLNNAPFSKTDLDEGSYYVKSGYGQQTVELINKESKEKFPSKTFSDLTLTLDPTDIIAYAYFLKEVEYEVAFGEKPMDFDGTQVKGFEAVNQAQKGNVRIIKYWNDDKFIISLKLKDQADELIIAKGFPMDSPLNVLGIIKDNIDNQAEYMSKDDLFAMPNLHLSSERDYNELVGQCLANEEFSDYCIAVMSERIKFDMDYKGARVENEAVISLSDTAIYDPEPKKIKRLIMDKPFWVVMKRTDSQNPYFLLGASNTKLMEME